MKFICKSPGIESEEINAVHPKDAARLYATRNCLDDTTIDVHAPMAGQGFAGRMVNTYSVYARHTIVYDLTFVSSQEL